MIMWGFVSLEHDLQTSTAIYTLGGLRKRSPGHGYHAWLEQSTRHIIFKLFSKQKIEKQNELQKHSATQKKPKGTDQLNQKENKTNANKIEVVYCFANRDTIYTENILYGHGSKWSRFYIINTEATFELVCVNINKDHGSHRLEGLTSASKWLLITTKDGHGNSNEGLS